MSRLFFITLFSFCVLPAGAGAVEISFERMYKEMAAAHQDGRLPEYMKEALPDLTVPQPDHVPDASVAEEEAVLKPVETAKEEPPEEKPWSDVVRAVQEGRMNAFDLQRIRQQAAKGDGEALELLAFMHARGFGLRKDLPQAWHLYMKAASVGVKGAEDNAKAVYKVMTPAERKRLMPF